MFAALLHDFRYTLRQLRKSPGFTLTAVLTLAIGIGATTAIFSLIWSVMLKPLPVEHPEQLYKIGAKNMCCITGGTQGDWGLFSNDLYEYLRDHTKGIKSLAALQSGTDIFSVRRDGEKAEAAPGRYVSGNYFSTLGAPVLRGRPLIMSDDREGAPPVAVISYHFWRRQFALDPSVIGGTLLINGTGVTIVGVTPPGFYGLILNDNPPSFWIPVHQEVNLAKVSPLLNKPDSHWLDLVGRVAPGTDLRHVDAQLTIELQQWLQTRIASMEKFTPGAAQSIPDQRAELAPAAASANNIRDHFQKGLFLLLWAALAVLLIVCANVAGLMLVRAIARRRQTAISVALGAERAQLIRQSLVFSVTLALIGGLGALAVAYSVTSMMISLAFRGAPYVPIDASPSGPVLAFAFGASLVTGIVFGLVPAWFGSRGDPGDALRGASRGSAGETGARPQGILVILQAALSVALLCAAGLLLRSLNNLEHQNFGFESHGRVIAQIDPALAGVQFHNLDAFYQRLRERLGEIPGVAAVSYSTYTPMTFNTWSTPVFFPGRPVSNVRDLPSCSYVLVGPDYFRAIGARILRGRGITEEDNDNARPIAVVNQAFAKKYFGGNAIGRHFGMHPHLNSQFEIVGVSENTKYRNPQQPAPPMLYLSMGQHFDVAPSTKPEDISTVYFARDVILAFQGSAAGKEQAVRTAMAGVNPNLAPQVNTLEEQVGENLSAETLVGRFTAFFGLIALLLASIGLYGVTSYSVVRRTGEIGIRMALGADRMQVMRTVMRRAMAQALLGLALGIPLAWLAGQLLANRLYEVSAFDPLIVTVAVACLAVSAALAALLPARRAAGVNPVEALRNE